jgi:hypothetical protein
MSSTEYCTLRCPFCQCESRFRAPSTTDRALPERKRVTDPSTRASDHRGKKKVIYRRLTFRQITRSCDGTACAVSQLQDYRISGEASRLAQRQTPSLAVYSYAQNGLAEQEVAA